MVKLKFRWSKWSKLTRYAHARWAWPNWWKSNEVKVMGQDSFLGQSQWSRPKIGGQESRGGHSHRPCTNTRDRGQDSWPPILGLDHWLWPRKLSWPMTWPHYLFHKLGNAHRACAYLVNFDHLNLSLTVDFSPIFGPWPLTKVKIPVAGVCTGSMGVTTLEESWPRLRVFAQGLWEWSPLDSDGHYLFSKVGFFQNSNVIGP